MQKVVGSNPISRFSGPRDAEIGPATARVNAWGNRLQASCTLQNRQAWLPVRRIET